MDTQPNPLPGDGVEITLGGATHVMRLNMRAFRALAKAFKSDPFQGEFWKDMSVEKFRLTFWASLLHENKDLTEEQADEMMDGLTYFEVIEAVNKCVVASMPSRAEEATPEPAIEATPSE